MAVAVVSYASCASCALRLGLGLSLGLGLGLALLPHAALAQAPLKLLVVVERSQQSLLSELSRSLAGRWLDAAVAVDRDENEEDSFREVCSALSNGASLVLDLTWSGWRRLRDLAARAGIPYICGEVSIRPFLEAADDTLAHRNVTDAALVFSSSSDLDQGLYYLVGRSPLRVVVMNGLEGIAARRLVRMRPTPTMFLVFAGGKEASNLLSQAKDIGLVQRYSRWGVVLTDFQSDALDRTPLQNSVSHTTILTPRADVCCTLRGEETPCACPRGTKLAQLVAPALGEALVALASTAQDAGVSLPEVRVSDVKECASTPASEWPTPLPDDEGSSVTASMETASTAAADQPVQSRLHQLMAQVTADKPGLHWDPEESRLQPHLNIHVEVVNGSVAAEPTPPVQVGTWTPGARFNTEPGQAMPPIKRYFRVGAVESVPWTYPDVDPVTGQQLYDEDGKPKWTGYCIDFIHRLSELMDFDFELVMPENGSFGRRDKKTGVWDGAVGDLAVGETDILVSALTMTSEREEVIDFVPPYFEQSGISIVIRKPVRKTSLFKFMTVLRLEVWLSIIAALVVTGFMIWLLDKYSPYSARNNKEMYPYPCREFTLKESFWFALTSFTPQGGGEAPKALSGRTLVAAYWLFVVLMLATFTANLAAFLTVERMQTPVQSLEQLARQSRINYSVVEGSETHAYFKNMKHAEDTLYRVWKEITLNASSDQSQYRVWDYPIKEQYGHILLAIEKAGPVPNASIGFQRVLDSEDAEYAFIHNAAQVRYEVSKNCNLSEVGEVFAEQPYAVAVQQGSYLQEEISRRILELQKDRYFELLVAKYWNYSALADCANSGDNEGITLESLGGVFIATLFGLAFAMMTLAGEVFYHKRKKKVAQKAAQDGGDGSGGAPGMITTISPLEVGTLALDKKGESVLLGHGHAKRRKDRVAPEPILGPNKVSYISVYPRDFY